ncbi:GD12735 [Drosophila simulans]|uniref:GD12735 n=1 Tax=Drosophila simulans TaxID=7240 RepID=B4QR79_DROSI|nr:GD12735 [Drosophila simulans]
METQAIHFDLAEEPKGLCVPEAVNEPSAQPTHLALIHSMPDVSIVLDSLRPLENLCDFGTANDSRRPRPFPLLHHPQSGCRNPDVIRSRRMCLLKSSANQMPNEDGAFSKRKLTATIAGCQDDGIESSSMTPGCAHLLSLPFPLSSEEQQPFGAGGAQWVSTAAMLILIRLSILLLILIRILIRIPSHNQNRGHNHSITTALTVK